MVLVVALSDDDDDNAASSPAAPAAQEPARAQSPLERQVVAIVTGVEVKAEEQDDRPQFRAPRQPVVRCETDACEITYRVGLPGRGRILEDQREIWERLFGETDVERATMRVIRDIEAASVPRNEEGEETDTGDVILETTCDRSKQPDVDWANTDGVTILAKICEATYGAGGGVEEQETVAPDDPAARGAGGRGQRGE